MKKLFKQSLAIVTSVMLFNSPASNASEYVISNCEECSKDKVYEIVSKYRFPSILSRFTQEEFKKEYPNLELIETFKTKENEYKFLQNEIMKIDKNAKIYSIPKSLYQFITYDYFASKIQIPEDCTLSTLFSEVYKQKNKFILSKYAKDNEEWSLTKVCSSFMTNNDIKNIFFKVNDHAKNLYAKCGGEIETTVSELLRAYETKRLFDTWNINEEQAQNKSTLSRIEILCGRTFTGGTPQGWSEEKRQNLKNYIKNIITSEDKNDNYLLYHAGNFDNPSSEIAYRHTICLSDGLGSGFLFDAGASAFVLSGGKTKLYRLALDREKLLNAKYPIFIPPAHHLLSGAGNGELFHVRTKVVQAVISDDTNGIDKLALTIKNVTKPIVPGYQLNQTPEYFTTTNPQILRRIGSYGYYKYEKTSQGIFDKKSAESLDNILSEFKKVHGNGNFILD